MFRENETCTFNQLSSIVLWPSPNNETLNWINNGNPHETRTISRTLRPPWAKFYEIFNSPFNTSKEDFFHIAIDSLLPFTSRWSARNWEQKKYYSLHLASFKFRFARLLTHFTFNSHKQFNRLYFVKRKLKFTWSFTSDHEAVQLECGEIFRFAFVFLSADTREVRKV